MRAFAVVEGSTSIVDIEVPTPVPEGSQVLLRVIHSGVCHTDTHLRQGYYDLGSRGELRLVDRGIRYPLVMGHEVVGVVEQVGPDVTTSSPGQTRLVYPWIGCGECRQCENGQDNHCAAGRNLGVAAHGGYADHILVPDEKYLIDIEGLDPAWAATLACSGLTAYSAVNKVLPLLPEEPVAVVGAGGVGLTAVATLRALGHEAICAVDLSEENLRVAGRIGASEIVRSDGGDFSGRLVEACGEPVAAVIDFVNNSGTAAASYSALRKAGKLVQVGLFGGELTMATVLNALKMLTVQGSFVGSPDELRQLVSLAKQDLIPTIPIIREPLTAESVAASLDRLSRGGVAGRIVLQA